MMYSPVPPPRQVPAEGRPGVPSPTHTCLPPLRSSFMMHVMQNRPAIRTACLQAVLITVTACLAAIAANSLSPRGIPWQQDWGAHVERMAEEAGLRPLLYDDVQRLVQDGSAFLFDARPREDYGAGHIDGAMSLPAKEMETAFPEVAPMLAPDMHLVVYCSGKECDESLQLGIYLKQEGLTNVSIYVGGYADWSARTGAGTE